MADNPFDLVQMINLSRALRARGRTSLADIWNYKVRLLLMAILSTGTGTDEENARFVIEPQHEYILLNALGLTAKKHIFIEPCYEYISVADAEGHNLGGFTSISPHPSKNTGASIPGIIPFHVNPSLSPMPKLVSLIAAGFLALGTFQAAAAVVADTLTLQSPKLPQP